MDHLIYDLARARIADMHREAESWNRHRSLIPRKPRFWRRSKPAPAPAPAVPVIPPVDPFDQVLRHN